MDSGRNIERNPVSLYVYVTTHTHSRFIGAAFAKGANAPTVGTFRLQPTGAAAIYGRLRGCNEILQAAKDEGRDFYYIDRGYMRATRDDDYSGYFRVSKNSLQSDGTGTPNYDRFASLGISIKPWREGGSHVLICPPGDVYGKLSGFNSDEWTLNAVATLRRSTDRLIRIREKPRHGQRNVTLLDDLKNCWAMVVHSSNAAVDALLMGVPVFATDACGASFCASKDLSSIEKPFFPDNREEWAANLAAQQWTISEMESGIAWRDLQNE